MPSKPWWQAQDPKQPNTKKNYSIIRATWPYLVLCIFVGAGLMWVGLR